MRKKLRIIIPALCMLACLLCACDAQSAGSVKSLTRPYINRYECICARYGEYDLLEKFDYITITLLDESRLEVKFGIKNGDEKSRACDYTYDAATGELGADFGILGADCMEKAVIKNGRFSVSRQIGSKLLVLVFEVK